MLSPVFVNQPIYHYVHFLAIFPQCRVTEQGKQSQANRSEPHQHPSGEEVDEGIEKEEKEDVPIQEDEETGQNNPAELEQMEQEQEVRGAL